MSEKRKIWRGSLTLRQWIIEVHNQALQERALGTVRATGLRIQQVPSIGRHSGRGVGPRRVL